jgi:hypothetical protein
VFERYAPLMVKDYIRCGTPDCDWGFEISNFSETEFKKCFAKFREHCVERHELRETDINARMFLGRNGR